MRRFMCGCSFEPLDCVFDKDDFPVCDIHGMRLYGWASSTVSEPPPFALSATEKRRAARVRVEALAARVSVGEALS